MMLKNTRTTYGALSRALHWVMALLIIAMYIVAYSMLNAAPSPTKWWLYSLHKATGIVVAIFWIIRIIWRLNNYVPAPPAFPMLSKLHHYMLYLLMIVMPVSGIAMSILGGYEIDVYGLFVIPAMANKNPEMSHTFQSIHEVTSYFLLAALSMHFLAGGYHKIKRHSSM